MNLSDQLFVGNLQSLSLYAIVARKLDYMIAEEMNAKSNGLYQSTITQVERPLIELALEHCGGNQLRAAKLLGINRNTLKSKMDQLNICLR